MERETTKWTTVRRAEAFCEVAATKNWGAASRKLSPSGAARNRGAVHLVEEFARDLDPLSQRTLVRTVPAAERDKPEESVRLTADGETVLPVALDFLHAAMALRDIFTSENRALRLACYPAHLRKIVAPLLADGAVRLDVVAADDTLREDEGQPLFDMLDEAVADVVIAPLRQRPRFSKIKLYDFELRAVFAIGHPLGRSNEEVSAQDLRDEPLLVSPPDHTSRQVVDAVMSSAGLTPVIRYQNASTESLLAYAEAGLGIAIVPEDALWESRARGARPFASNAVGLGHGLHWSPRRLENDPRLAELTRALAPDGDVAGVDDAKQ